MLLESRVCLEHSHSIVQLLGFCNKESRSGGWVNAYSERYYGFSDNIAYVSDSNRREFWNEERMGNAIANGRNLTLLTHPVWWHHSALSSDETFVYLSETAGSRHAALYFAATAKRYADKCPEEIIRC